MSNAPNAHSRAIEAAHKVMVGFGPPKRGITITEDTIKAIQKEVEVQKYAADNYRRLLDESDHAYAELRDERDELLAENEKLSDMWSAMKAERDAFKTHAELRYTAFQNPHNDDRWLEHPADSEIIDEFDPPVHVGFQYELTAGSYTTQRYRVTKIADDESDDVEVELIAAIQGAGK